MIVVTVLATICGFALPELRIVNERGAMIKKMVGERWIVVESDSPLANGPNWVRRAMCDITIEAAMAPALATDDELNQVQVRKTFLEAQICPASETQEVARVQDTDVRRFLFSREKQ